MSTGSKLTETTKERFSDKTYKFFSLLKLTIQIQMPYIGNIYIVMLHDCSMQQLAFTSCAHNRSAHETSLSVLA